MASEPCQPGLLFEEGLNKVLMQVQKLKCANRFASIVEIRLSELPGVTDSAFYVSSSGGKSIYRPMYDFSTTEHNLKSDLLTYKSTDPSNFFIIQIQAHSSYISSLQAFGAKLETLYLKITNSLNMTDQEFHKRSMAMLCADSFTKSLEAFDFVTWSMSINSFSLYSIQSGNHLSLVTAKPTQYQNAKLTAQLETPAQNPLFDDEYLIYKSGTNHLFVLYSLVPSRSYTYQNVHLFLSFVDFLSQSTPVNSEIPSGNEKPSSNDTKLFAPDMYSDDILDTIVSVFEEFELLSVYRISKDKLYQFLRVMRSRYPFNHYHNWFHAFSVFYASQLFLKKSGIEFTKLEILSLFFAALCHDLSHPGTNNRYLIKYKRPLGILFKDGCALEIFHCSEAIRLFSEDSGVNGILAGLSEEESIHFWQIVIDLILATDVANYKANAEKYRDQINMDQESDRKTMLTLIMEASDLSGSAGDYDNACRWATLVQEEIIEVNTKERKLDSNVPAIDRCLITFLRGQVGFVEGLCLPLFNYIKQCIPQAECMVADTWNNLERWKQQLSEKERELKMI